MNTLPEPAGSTALTPTVDPEKSLATLGTLLDQVRAHVENSTAKNTRRAYLTDWKDFYAWCEAHGHTALPATPNTVAFYITDLAARGSWLSRDIEKDCKPCMVPTIVRKLAAISRQHRAAHHESPCALKNPEVKAVLSGIKRTMGTAPAGKDPLLTDDVRRLLKFTPDNLLGKRDRALLLLGFAGAFRRSELCALNKADLDFGRDGMKVKVRFSKTDQVGEGRKVAIPYGSNPELCPIRNLGGWMDAAGINDGPVFRAVSRHGRVSSNALTDQVVWNVIKRYCKKAGLNPAKFGAHSLRSGFVTQASINDATERSIMNQTGHKSVVMVRRYIRDANLFRDNAATRLGL
jgi:integrase